MDKIDSVRKYLGCPHPGMTPLRFPLATGYGYQWWKNTININGQNFNYSFAGGWGEQYVFLIPQKNMLVLMTAGYFASPVTVSPFDLLHNYIYGSAQ